MTLIDVKKKYKSERLLAHKPTYVFKVLIYLNIISVDDTEEENLSLIDVEKKIRDDVSQLKKEKEERMKDYEEAREAEEAACEVTGSNPSYIVINRMPTDEQVRQIKDHTKHLKVIKIQTCQEDTL